jgi:hypothetical protein
MMTSARLAAALVAGLALAACGGDTTETPTPATAAPKPLVLSDPVTHLDALAREPMIVEHRNGTLFVTGYGAETPRLWRSGDGGATWAAVDVGDAASGAVGNSDVDLAIGPDGTLYFVAMTFDRKTFEGVSISVGVSRNVGNNWSWTQLSKTRFDDRPWVEVTPEGVAHVIWNDGKGVAYAVSRDGGETWQEQPRIHAQGGSSHFASGPAGELAVRIAPMSASGHTHHPDVDLIAVSPDGGATWTKHPAPGKRHWTYPLAENDPLPRWVEPLAFDASGHLYYLWTDTAGLWLARSVDGAAQWTTWKLAEGGPQRYFPYLTARGPGELAATWFSGHGADVQAHVARIDVPLGDRAPTMVEAPAFSPDSWKWNEKPDAPRNRDTAGEYIPVTFFRDGRIGIVTTIQDDQNKRMGFSFRTAHH